MHRPPLHRTPIGNAALLAMLLSGLLLGGCPPPPNPDDSPNPQSPAHGVQQRMPIGEFEQIVADDPKLQERLATASALHGTREIHSAGVLRDADGTELIWAALDLDDPGDAVIVRHCRGNDCVHVIQRFVGGEQEIIWTGPGGEIEPRTVLIPFLLRKYNETTGETTLATPSPELLVADTAKPVHPADTEPPRKPGTSATPRRCGRFYALSAFGRYFNGRLSDLGMYQAVMGMAQIMQSVGCTNATESYNVNRAQVNQLLSGMGPNDIFVLFAHGDESASQQRVIGMSLSNSIYWNTSDHYSETDFRRQFDANIFGGPGIVFLAGCASAGMLPQLDDPENPQRVIIGLSKDHYQTNVYNAMKLFFERYAACDSIQEAMAVVNASPGMALSNVRLVANASADLSRRMCEEESPPGPVTSTFDFDDDGWFIGPRTATFGNITGGGAPLYTATGGNPGGYVQWDDLGPGTFWFFRSPAKFHGDRSALYGKLLSFDLRSVHDTPENVGAAPLVVLSNGAQSLWYWNAPNPESTWTAYSIPLDTSAGWLVTSNWLSSTIATETEIRAVLAALSNISIRGEFGKGADTGGLDNVILGAD
ncbi:MAG: hypothetical protein IPM18_16950 [Phycisphaerales bacterium]|nr:hypothetical protein [Phycisphaerales bacterium]